MPKHVLVPVDESDQATRALEFAISEYPAATITALHVIDPAEYYAGTGMDEEILGSFDQTNEVVQNRNERVLERARSVGSGTDVDFQTASVTGGISRSVVQYAEENDVDHIVIGSHGREGAARVLLGSVAEKVARRSPVPVTIVR